MANYTSRKQIPVNSGGSYTPKEGEKPPKYVLKEKVGDMLKYAMPLVTAFPARDRAIADCLKDSMLKLYRLAVALEFTDDRASIARKLKVEFMVLKDFIVFASDRDAYAKKYAPPLSLKRREVWGRYNQDIGILIDGLL